MRGGWEKWGKVVERRIRGGGGRGEGITDSAFSPPPPVKVSLADKGNQPHRKKNGH